MHYLASVTRITDVDQESFGLRRLPRRRWNRGDLVVVQVLDATPPMDRVELADGRMVAIRMGDQVVGALGDRSATLEGVGSYSAVLADGVMHLMTSAGLLGRITSLSTLIPKLVEVEYRGHVERDGTPLNLEQYVERVPHEPLTIPVVVLVGTSMSAGKTTTGRLVVRELRSMGYRVAAAKLTGAARYQDIQSFADAGAEHIFDFLDVGLPSTVVGESVYRQAIDGLISRIAGLDVDVLVAEAGASPLEPYNGAAALEVLGDQVCCRILCASDPYAVVGVQAAFGFTPDLVTGPATSTQAAIDLVDKLTGVPALNVLQKRAGVPLGRLLRRCLDRWEGSAAAGPIPSDEVATGSALE